MNFPSRYFGRGFCVRGAIELDWNLIIYDTVYMLIRAELKTRDLIEAKVDEQGHVLALNVVACRACLDLLRSFRNKDPDPRQWVMPEGSSHSELLLREFLLRLRGQWKRPYLGDEICHCRVVKTETVDQAILAGAHTTNQVSRATNASTSCGTCVPDVQDLINYRLHGQ